MTESIIRIEQRRGFTVLQNEMLRDRRLCLKTKGLIAVMLSRPGNWQFSVSGLSAYTGAGRDAIRSALKELREAGYLTMEKQSHGERGKFAGSVYILHEESLRREEAAPWPDYPFTADPTTGEPTSSPSKLILSVCDFEYILKNNGFMNIGKKIPVHEAIILF